MDQMKCIKVVKCKRMKQLGIRKCKIKKNSFLDIRLEFNGVPYYKYDVKEGDVKNSNRFVRFDLKPLEMKQEIKLNDYLKPVLRKIEALNIVLEKQKSGIDTNKMNKLYLSYNNFILEYNKDTAMKKEIAYKDYGRPFKNGMRSISDQLPWDPYQLYYSNFFEQYAAILKKTPKKNCNTDHNKFSIKILNKREDTHMLIGLGEVDSNFEEAWNCENGWGFCFMGGECLKSFFSKPFGGPCEKGDIVSLKYDSIKGSIEIYKNRESLGILTDKVDTKKDYYFFVTLHYPADRIEMVDNI